MEKQATCLLQVAGPKQQLLLNHLDIGGKILGFAETGGWQTHMLFIGYVYSFAHGFVDLLGYGFIPDSEKKLLWNGSGHLHHGQFTLPGLANPSLFREFLDVSSPFALGIAPGQGYPDIDCKTGTGKKQSTGYPE
jgi:hypothetical protein